MDANLVLAEFAPGPAQEYALVTQAVAAGERALGQAASLLLEERTEAARARLRKLLAEYQGDPAACWAYSWALLAFQEAGAAAPDAERALKAAIKVNKGVPAYLLGDRQLPQDMPEYIHFGADSEAVDYAASAYRAWILTPGAMAWLREVSEGKGRRRF